MRSFQTSIYICIVLFSFACSENSAQKHEEKDSLNSANSDIFTDHLIDSAHCGLSFFPKRDYQEIRSEIIAQHHSFKAAWLRTGSNTEREKILDSARIYFTDALLNQLIPHWYGTVWDFNGYTHTPNSGVIACGYFISTTLEHAGLRMNRYTFAQQAGMNEAKTLDPEHSFSIFNIRYEHEIDSVVDILETDFKEGLYTVGLSNHVGYIYIYDNTAYFIHSNYIDGYVMTEKARYSNAFRSTIYLITDVTYNDYLIESWILNNEIPVVTD